jgi:tellurite resistance protein
MNMGQFLRVPASFFGIVLGLVGLGASWRAAARVWGLPPAIGETIMFVAIAVWAGLLVLFVAKWVGRRAEALAEFEHPVQCCFIGLIPVSTMLIALAVLPYSRPLAVVIGSIGAAGQLIFAIYRTGSLWTGGRDPATTTPILYLPTVAGNFVTANLTAALGYGDIAAMFFGAAIFAWLALESVLMHRLYTLPSLPLPLRPTLGIQLAPAVVACSAYLPMTTGQPDLFAKGLLGYGLIQALILARLSPWIMQQPFGASYWAFTFGLTALSFDAIRLVERGSGGVMPNLAVGLFVFVNAAVGLIVAGTVWLLVSGRLIPQPQPAAMPRP